MCAWVKSPEAERWGRTRDEHRGIKKETIDVLGSSGGWEGDSVESPCLVCMGPRVPSPVLGVGGGENRTLEC